MITTRHNAADQRCGFTLIEILVVLGLIVFLASISITVVANYVETAREAATRTTLLKINRMLNERLNAFQRTLKGPHFDRQVDAKNVALQRQDIYGLRPHSVEVLVKNDSLRKYFPQRFADIPQFALKQTASNPKFTNHVTGNGTESSEMLYYMLTSMKVFGVAPVDPGEFEGALMDTDNDGLLELVDAWEQPLRFYRWPTRLIRPGGWGNPVDRQIAGALIVGLPAPPLTGRDELTLDPYDPTGAIGRDLGRVPNLATVYNEPRYRTLETFHAPLVVSPGPDRNLGLFEPTDVGNFGHLAQPDGSGVDPLFDNFTNRNIVVGGN